MSEEILRKAAAYLRNGVGCDYFVQYLGEGGLSKLVDASRELRESDRDAKIRAELDAGRPLLAYIGFQGWRMHLVEPVKHEPDMFRPLCGRLTRRHMVKSRYVSMHSVYFQGEHDKQADCPACLREQERRV